MVHAAMKIVKVTFCSKDKRKKRVLDGVAFMINYISVYKSQMTYMGLDCEAEKLRIKAELKVMMAELQLKLNWANLKTIPCDIFIPVNSGEAYHVNEN